VLDRSSRPVAQPIKYDIMERAVEN